MDNRTIDKAKDSLDNLISEFESEIEELQRQLRMSESDKEDLENHVEKLKNDIKELEAQIEYFESNLPS